MPSYTTGKSRGFRNTDRTSTKKFKKKKRKIEETEYDGPLVDGKRHGSGVLRWNDGREYSGAFERGEMTGKGRMVFADGRTYEGEFVGGSMEGEGKMRWKMGKRYEGVKDPDYLDPVGSGVAKAPR